MAETNNNNQVVFGDPSNGAALKTELILSGDGTAAKARISISLSEHNGWSTKERELSLPEARELMRKLLHLVERGEDFEKNYGI